MADATSNATTSNVGDSATSVTLLSHNPNRRNGTVILNDSPATLYLKFGTTATTSDFTFKVLPGDHLVLRDYVGRIDGIWSANTAGVARITELT